MQTFKEYVEETKANLKDYVDMLSVKPKLVIINIGDDVASNVYIKGKMADCTECGIISELVHYEATVDEQIVLDKIEQLNNDDSVTGFILQLPIPKHLNKEKLIAAIAPRKDVDGFTKEAIVDPATPKGIINYLEAQKYIFEDKIVVVIGRSDIVGKPMARLLLAKNCNVIQLHSKTSEANKRLLLKHADLIITATGHKDLIDNTYELKPSAYIIDAGINKDENGKLIGDCERDLPVAFQSVVPGSVGLTTRLTLLTNLMKLYTYHEC